MLTEIDYGTPARDDRARTVTLEIDGKPVTVPAGTSRDARRRRGRRRRCPKLCATDSLEPFGSCRLCLVEIEGRARHARLLHHAGRGRHEGAHPDAQARRSCAAA